MITADTITDEQIRELIDRLRSERPGASNMRKAAIADDLHICQVALYTKSVPHRARMRARCAEILNARAKESK